LIVNHGLAPRLLSEGASRGQALTWANLSIAAADAANESPKLDATLLLCHVLSVTTASLLAWPEKPISADQQAALEGLVRQRCEGQPIAYLLGEQGFWSLDLQVDSSTLIPRPETELLVELVLDLDLPPAAHVMDLGTGTGAIALALASEHPAWQIVGVDQSPQAVALAKKNALSCRLPQVHFEEGNWAQSFCKNPAKPLHCIVSNPPYIDSQDPHLQQGDVRFEPLSALVAPDSGLADIKIITLQAVNLLADKGWLAFEHGYDQGVAVRELLSKAGFVQVATHKDYNHQDRVTFGQWHCNP